MSDKIKLTRRDMLKTTGAGIVTGVMATQSAQAAPMPARKLGKTGETLSMLTLGCGHLRERNMSASEAVEIVHRALELGVTSIDTAPNYSESEDFVGEALKGKRNKVFLATKNEEADYDGAWKLLQRSLERLQTDHVELVYIHNFGYEDRFPDVEKTLGPKGILGALMKAKEEGIVRFIGVSGHLYPSRWKAVLERDEIDVVMCAVNYVARHQYNFEDKVFDQAKKKGLGQVAMKVLGGSSQGKARFPDNLDLCVRYALSLPGVCTANIGARSPQELEEVAKYVKNFKPLNQQELALLNKKGEKLAEEQGPLYGNPVT